MPTKETPRYLNQENYAAWKVTPQDFNPEDIGSLIKWAILAPNSHNTQPWAFDVKGNTIAISPDLNRGLGVSDPTLRQMYISIGAAVGNLKIAAHHFGYNTKETIVENPNGRVIKQVHLTGGYIPTQEDHDLFEAIPKRVSNRNPHTERELPQGIRESIAEVASLDGIDATLIEDRAKKERIGLLVFAGTRIVLSDPGFIGELSVWARPNNTREPDGMPGFGFGIPDFQSKFFPTIVRSGMLSASAAEQEKMQLSEKTAAIGIISTRDDSPEAWLNAGEAYEKIALKAESMGLATNVLAVLVETRDLHIDLQQLADTTYRPAIMFRVGYPEQAPHHAPRRPKRDVMMVGYGEERDVVAADKPRIFTLRNGLYELDDLRRELGKDVEVINDYANEFLTELIIRRNPQVDFRTPEGLRFLEEQVSRRANDYDGKWAYFPWEKKLTHIPNREEYLELLYICNFPNIDRQTQEELGRLRVNIAGLSVGGNIARALAMTGVTHIGIADFDTTSLSNNPRMNMGSVLHVGDWKSRQLIHELYEFNPYGDFTEYRMGVNEANIAEFVRSAGIIDDHIDSIAIKIRLREEAKKQGRLFLMATGLGWGGTFEMEQPGSQPFNGRVPEEVVDYLRKPPTDITKWVGNAAQIMGIDNMPASVLENFLAVIDKKTNTLSQLGPAGYTVAAAVAWQVYQIAKGNIGKMPPFFAISLEQPEVHDPEEDERARRVFRERVYGKTQLT